MQDIKTEGELSLPSIKLRATSQRGRFHLEAAFRYQMHPIKLMVFERFLRTVY